MALTETQIANIALRRVGANTITSFNDGSNEAQTVNDLFPLIRDEMLSEHTWRFSKKQVELAQNAIKGLQYGFLYSYALPQDCLYVLNMEDDAAYSVMLTTDPADSSKSIKSLVTDEATAKITYRSQVTNTGLWDAYFTSAVVKRLAMELATSLAHSVVLAGELAEEYALAITSAITNDSMESPIIKIVSPTVLIDARSTGFGIWGSDFDHKLV